MSDSIDTATAKEFDFAKDTIYFYTSEDNVTVDTDKNLASAEDTGSANNVDSTKNDFFKRRCFFCRRR